LVEVDFAFVGFAAFAVVDEEEGAGEAEGRDGFVGG